MRRFGVGTLVLVSLARPGPALAQTEGERVWTFSLDETAPRRALLFYGVPETDDSFSSFRCKAKSGVVTVFVSETGDKLKVGARARAILAVGETRAKLSGKLLPNQLAGVPSFEARLPADDPIFEAMASGERLVVTIASYKQTAPLTGAVEKVEKFIVACAKP